MSIVKISAGSYSPDVSINTIFCDTTKGEINIILPNIQDSQLDRKLDYEFFIIDISDNASKNNIVLQGLNANGQQVNSKDKIVLAQDGVVATLKPASYLNWVCNVSSLEAQQVVGLSAISKTNTILYNTPVSQLQLLRGNRLAPPYASYQKQLYPNCSFLCNIGNDNDYLVYASFSAEIIKGSLPTYILFKRTSENSMIPVDVIEAKNLFWDAVNSTKNGFYFTSIIQEKENPYNWSISQEIYTIKNDKLIQSTKVQNFNIVDVFNKYTNLKIDEKTDAPIFEYSTIDYSGNNDYNAFLSGGAYGNYIYFYISTKGVSTRVFTNEEKVDNIIGINMNNINEGLRVSVLTDILNTNFNFDDKLKADKKTLADYLLKFQGQWLYTNTGIIFSFSDGREIVKSGVTEENKLYGLTTIYSPQANKRIYQTIQEVGLDSLPIVSGGNIYSILKSSLTTFTKSGLIILYPSNLGSGDLIRPTEGFNMVGVAYNLITGTSKSFNTPVKGVLSSSVTGITYINTNDGVLYDVVEELSSKNQRYSSGEINSIYVDSNGNATSIQTSASGLVNYSSFTNNSLISTRNDGNSLKGIMILEDVFQNVNNFN